MIDTNARNRTMLRVAVTTTTLQQPTLGQRRTVQYGTRAGTSVNS